MEGSIGVQERAVVRWSKVKEGGLKGLQKWCEMQQHSIEFISCGPSP